MKFVPFVGGIIGGIVDVGSTKLIANNAYILFIKKQMPGEEIEETLNEVIEEGIKDSSVELVEEL